MPTELTMPALSPTMEKGTLARWLVKEGDEVRTGDVLAEIETDKATMDLEAIDEGRVARIVVAAGTDGVAVGAVIALLAETGDDADAVAPAPAAAKPAEKPRPASPSPAAAIVPPPAKPAPDAAGPQSDGPVKASPLARRIATARGLSLAGIKGSGPQGRVIKADLGLDPIPTSVPPAAAAASPALAAVSPPPAGVPVQTAALSAMRKTIARRLTESKQTIPHFYLTVRCRLDALLGLRARLNDSLTARGVKISVNDMLVKAMAGAMIAVPEVNVQFAGDELHRFGRVDVAMAVAIDGGLITPVIENAGALSLSGIAERSKALAAKARDGKLRPEEYQGGTASISNLGMYGIDEMVPVINPPQALILGIGAGVRQPWDVDGEIALATIMAATASFDHRAIDGVTAAEFMAAFRERVENPLQLLV